MRITDIHKLVDMADRVYRDAAFQNLRQKHDDREALVYNQLPVLVPEKMVNRVRQVHQGAAMDKVARGMALITDPLGVRIDVAKVGKSEKAELLRERVRAWLLSFYRDLERRGAQDGTLDWLIKWGVIVHSVCAVRVQPYTAAWAPLLAGKARKQELDLSDTHTPDEVADRVNEFLAEAAGLPDDDDADAVTRRILPMQITYVPGHCLRWESDQFSRHLGPKWVMEYREMSVEDVLDTYLDAGGKPLAQNLKRSVEHQELSPESTCTVVIRSDREHMQIFVSGLVLDQATGDLSTRVRQGNDELLWEGPHHLGRTPYAIFTGRVTPARELVHRFQGLLDPAFELFLELDQLATQLSSVRNFVAWPMSYIKRGAHAQGVAEKDRPAGIDLEEATIIDGTGVDESIETVPLTSREGLEWLQRDYEMKMAAADRLTFGGAAYGAGGVDSGYLQSQLESATTSTLEPFRIGCERGYEDFFQLVLRVAKTLHDRNLPAIPVRSCLPEGRQWEELDSSMTSYDWDITVSIQQQHPAGRMAMLNAVAFAEEKGYTTHEEAIREAGNPYPLQVMQQRAIETHANSPEMTQLINQLVQQQFMAALAQEQMGGMPNQPLIPPALAPILGQMASDPSMGALAARLPQPGGGQQFGVPGVSNMAAPPTAMQGGSFGSPNLFVNSQNPGVPTPRAETVNQGGGFAGVGQSSPGGVANQDFLNTLRR